MQQVNLGSDKYEELLKCLGILKDICNDVDIRGGIIRQRTNDSATVFEINLAPIIEDMSIPIINLKSKIELLKIFANQDSEVEISVEDNGNFTFSDQYTTLGFDGPELEFMDNKFMNEEERDAIFTMDEEDLVLQADLSQTITERIKIISAVYNTNSVIAEFCGETANLALMTQSKEQHADIMRDITTERVLECTSSLINTPFVFDHDGETSYKMFNFQDQLCNNIASTQLGDVEVNVYCRSSLVDVDDD